MPCIQINKLLHLMRFYINETLSTVVKNEILHTFVFGVDDKKDEEQLIIFCFLKLDDGMML